MFFRRDARMTDAVIFDIDGTLLDSVDLHTRAWQEAFEHYGHRFTFDSIRSQIGKGGDQIIPMFLDEGEARRIGKELEEFRKQLFKKKYLSQVRAFPKVRELFLKLKDNSQRVALASSASGDELETYERIAQISDLIEVRTSSSDADRSKPHPDIFEAALDRLGSDVERESVVVVGDSPYDAEAAVRAHLTVIGVLCGGFSEESLRAAGCREIFKDPADLLQRYDSSLLARK
jgi:HAD superfamily hydrolase (TIGR01549 family)